MNTKIILMVLFFLSSTILISQQSKQSPEGIFNSDYMDFRVQPEDILYPHLEIFELREFGLSMDLKIINRNDIVVDSNYLIDTVYFFGFDQIFTEYRRIFKYDDSSRIKSVVAEVLSDGEWLTHQVTKIIYNEFSNVAQINFVRYEDKMDSIILKYTYNDKGLLLSEITSEITKKDSIMIGGWVKNYFYQKNNLTKYTFQRLVKPNYYWPDSVKSRFNQDNLPIERTDYVYQIFGDSLKSVWRYNKFKQLTDYFSLSFEGSDTVSITHSKYEYDENGNIFRQIKLDDGETYPLMFEDQYRYNSYGSLDSIYQYGKLHLESSDSLLVESVITYNYDSNNLIREYQLLGIYEEKFGRKLIFDRDLFGNVTEVKELTFKGDSWKFGPSLRIIYRKK